MFIIGEILDILDIVMGFILLVVGISILDIIVSVLVVRKGKN